MKWWAGLLALIVVMLVCTDSRADEQNSLRISRPTFRMPQELRFTDGRQPLAINHFALWTRNYLHPVICSSVMCGGSCAAFLDSCPSFTGLSVLDFSQNFSLDSLLDASVESGARCPVNLRRGLVSSDGCGSSSCGAEGESSAKGSCCSP